MIFEPVFRFLEFELIDTQPRDILNIAKLEKYLNILLRLIRVH